MGSGGRPPELEGAVGAVAIHPPRVPSEPVADPRADLRQARVGAGAEAGVRNMLDIGDDIPVLIELVAKAARLAEVPAAAGVDAARLVPQRRGVDGAAELALEEEALIDRNAPGESGEAVARLAAGVDHAADVDARVEEPGEPLAADVAGIADRRRKDFHRQVDRRILVVYPIVGVDAEARLIEEIDVRA